MCIERVWAGSRYYPPIDKPISSTCSDIPIINALHRGVRVIELDKWPNSTKDNVEVLHGRYALIAMFLVLEVDQGFCY